MKTKKKGLINIGIVLLVILVSIIASKATVVYSEGQEIRLTITEAYYGDFDGDRREDDIRVKAVLDANFEADVLLFLYLDIVLPSGFVYKFNFQAIVEFEGPNKLVTITAFDTATEPGWYSCKLSGLAVYQDMLLYSYSTITFDPPNGSENGDPKAILAIT